MQLSQSLRYAQRYGILRTQTRLGDGIRRIRRRPIVKSDPARKELRSARKTAARGCACLSAPWRLLISSALARRAFCSLRGALSMQHQVGQEQPGHPPRPPTMATHQASTARQPPCPTLSYVAVKAPPLLFILFLGSPSLDSALRPALILRTEHKGASVHAHSSRSMGRAG